VVPGLEFSDTVDLTAIGTLALAVVTAIALVVGWLTLRQTKREIALSREEVEEAHRPVVVPIVVADPPDVTWVSAGLRTGPHTFPIRPCVFEAGVLILPVKNIGSGPALRLEAWVRRLDEMGNLWREPFEPQTPGMVAGLGKDQVIHIEIHTRGWEERWKFELTLVYEDVAGKGWVTVGRYIAERRRYMGVSIEALPMPT
jgi:hypothetical protein